MKLKVAEIQSICRSIGVQTSGTKQEVVDRLVDHIDQTLSQPPPQSVLAIDVGTANMGFIHIESDWKANSRRIIDWNVLHPSLPTTYQPVQYVQELQSLLDTNLPSSFDTVLVERQSWRRAVPHSILRSTAFEAMLVGMMASRLKSIKSVLPTAVATHFDLNGSDAAASRRYTQKKRNAVAVAQGILGGIECPPMLKKRFMEAKKKDDMSDALLMAIAYLDWHHSIQKLSAPQK